MGKVVIDVAWLAEQIAPPVTQARKDGLQPCGTAAAAQRHYARGEKPCEECRQARNRYRQQLAITGPTRQSQPCGTYAASRRHYRRGEKPCEPCRRAAAAYWADLTARKNAGRPPRPVPECGTSQAARRHRRAGQPLDWACQEAERAASTAWRAKARLAAGSAS